MNWLLYNSIIRFISVENDEQLLPLELHLQNLWQSTFLVWLVEQYQPIGRVQVTHLESMIDYLYLSFFLLILL